MMSADESDIRSDRDAIRAGWQRASLARGWRLPADWWSPAVEQVLHAVIADEPLTEPCAGLGSERAEAGVGLGEAFDDLWSLFSVLHRLPPARLVRRFAESYTASAPSAEMLTESVDPLTGLANAEYLRTRLGEVYQEAAARGVHADQHHGLVSMRFDTFSLAWGDLANRLAVGRILRSTFSTGETVAEVCPTVAAVLTHARTVMPPQLPKQLSEAADSDVSVRSIRLPATLAGALMQLEVLAEAGNPETPHTQGGKS